MHQEFGRTVYGRNGYEVREVFERDANGEMVSAGYAVLSPDGSVVGHDFNKEGAINRLDELVDQLEQDSTVETPNNDLSQGPGF